MSAGITFWCDHQMQYGSCPQQISLTTTDMPAARTAAERSGWQLKTSGDLCARYHAPKPRAHRQGATT